MDGIVVRENGGRKKFYGIKREARRLGVRYEHLWMVLTGRRESRSLMRRVRISYPQEAR
jgi:hypothetical protein